MTAGTAQRGTSRGCSDDRGGGGPEQIRLCGLDPAEDRGGLRDMVEAAVDEYDRRSMVSSLPLIGELEAAVKHILDSVAGFGELQPLLEDDTIEEIWINGPQLVR
ncbi:hypothetical protein GCM10009674_03530 [Nesterenkonia xinjiangensis]